MPCSRGGVSCREVNASCVSVEEEEEEELAMFAWRGFLSRGERVLCFGPDGVGWSGLQRLKHR